MIKPPENLSNFESLLEIVKALRGPEGCPWDKEQTHRTLTRFAIEEAHELAEAIEQGSRDELVSELGDLLLQVVLHAEIGRQENNFHMNDVIRSISEKMVRRHPHVFSDQKVTDSSQVLENWSRIKAQEKAAKDQDRISENMTGKERQTEQQTPIGAQKNTMRFDVALSLPALSRSQKIGEKTNRLRFDWHNPESVLQKVDEELNELKHEIKASNRDRAALEHEVGDLLFSVTQLARHLGLEAEQCLRTANSRFEHRYFTMRKMIEDSGRAYEDLSDSDLEAAWQLAKKTLALDTSPS
jgi:tetrapyrrole methylase family protein/MazG family protein